MRRIGNKRGEWQSYLLPAILSIVVLAIVFYFIFNEYFTGDDNDREVCKQSVVLRSTLREVSLSGFTPTSFKDTYPLKCKTNVVTIEAEDVRNGNAEKLIGDAMVECWTTFLSGDFMIFPASFFGQKTACVPCARIRLTNEAKEEVKKKKNGKIDIEGLLVGEKLEDKTYYINYLKGVGKLYEPFNPGFISPFNLKGDSSKDYGFSIGEFVGKEKEIRTKLHNSIDIGEGKIAPVSLPKYMDPDKGDLVIVFGQLIDSGEVKTQRHLSYMIYFQNGQENYADEFGKNFFNKWDNSKICGEWDGIPA
jgi:hypothetical protein